MFVNLNDTKSPVIILVQDCFDAGRFSCTGISEEKTVVGRLSGKEGFCVVNEFFLGNVVSNQVVKMYMSNSCNRDNVHLIAGSIMLQAEGFVKAKFSHTEIFIKIYHMLHKVFRGNRLSQKLA